MGTIVGELDLKLKMVVLIYDEVTIAGNCRNAKELIPANDLKINDNINSLNSNRRYDTNRFIVIE